MNKNFIISGLVTSVINLALHASAYFFYLKDFFASHPAGPEEFVKQLSRSPDGFIGWAMAVTALSMGFFITLLMKWSGATTFLSGLKKGFPLAALFWSSVNFGLYASSHYFSLPSVLADLACSVTIMTLSGAASAWILGGRTTNHSKIYIIKTEN